MSARVLPGRSLAVVGPSGSGKSTLLRCLTGLLVPSSGSVSIDGTVVSSLPEAKRSAFRLCSIGVVQQDPLLLDELDVADNAGLALILTGVSRRSARAKAIEVLSSLGLASRAHAAVHEISGGESQRVAIARAIVKSDLAAVIADEPTASLDRANSRVVVDALLSLCGTADIPLVVATHDPEVYERCDEQLDLR